MTSCDDAEDDNRPNTPAEEDCCGNACNPCVFDVHKKLLEAWEKKKLNERKIPPDKNYLSLTRYNKFIIKDIRKACEECIFIQLECGSGNQDDVLFLYPSQHIMIKLTSVSKPYTPISWNLRSLKLFIKLYHNGKASECIRNRKVGDELFARGPYGEFRYQQNSFKHIVMLSIGTGIAAVYPVAVSIVENELEDTRIRMVSGFRSFAHVPLKDELRVLSDYWNFECTLFLSRQESDMNITGINIVNSRLNGEKMNEILDSYSSESTLILICGTEEFNESVEKIVAEKKFVHHTFR